MQVALEKDSQRQTLYIAEQPLRVAILRAKPVNDYRRYRRHGMVA